MNQRALLRWAFSLTVVVLLLTGCSRVSVTSTAVTSTPISPAATSTSGSLTTASKLVGTKWALISLHGNNLIEGTSITLNFSAGFLSGLMSCNAYGGGPDSGKYIATDEGTLTIPQLAVTVQLCSKPEGIMQQEETYIKTLQQATTYRVVDDRLEIHNEAAAILVFVRQ